MELPSIAWSLVKSYMLQDERILAQNIKEMFSSKQLYDFLTVKRIKGRSLLKTKKARVEYIAKNHDNEIRSYMYNIFYLYNYVKDIDVYISECDIFFKKALELNITEFKIFLGMFNYKSTRAMILSINMERLNKLHKLTKKLFRAFRYRDFIDMMFLNSLKFIISTVALDDDLS